jgi:adenosylcobinamide-phosphate synthase
MSLEYQIIIAIVLDLVFGDPRWLPHPVRVIGRFAELMEHPARSAIKNPRLAGVAVAAGTILFTGIAVWGLINLASQLHPFLGDLVSIYFLYAGIAARDMLAHSKAVYAAICSGSIPEARNRVAMICGRDTDTLDEAGVIKATVESVAENMVDAVTAPLFYAVLGGPMGIMVYKAINTLDSTFGYKNEKYREFGWASAKIDDMANYLPARITGLLVPLAAFVTKQKWLLSAWIFVRDRRKHPSPNAGHPEAAMAGALGIQLGGLSFYGGQPSQKPTLGDPIFPIKPVHITRANSLLLVTSGIALAFFLATRLIVIHMVS